jgi:predicted AlkP superfamily phosphohydrolase/phosphomutase
MFLTLALGAMLTGCDGGEAPAGGEATAGDAAADASAARADGTHPFLFIGIDGAEWSVLEDLWAQGKLPNLKKLCDSGVCGRSVGEYSSSPIIWTTVATGMEAEHHGIEGFTIKGDDGNLIPVSSTMRKVPAIWNLLSDAGQKVGVLGWWVTWPAEAINGAMITERASKPDVDDRVHPAALQDTFDASVEDATRDEGIFPLCDQFAENDAWVGYHGKKLAAQLKSGDYSLVMAYFRCVDVVSHLYWAYYEPEKFKNLDPTDIKNFGSVIPANYEATDLMVGELLEAVGDEVNVVLASDHGFYAMDKEDIVVRLLMDRVFAYLGYSQLDGENPILAESKLYAYNSRPKRRRQLIRFARQGREEGGTVTPDQEQALRDELTEKLNKFKYESGKSVMKVRDAKPEEIELGADFVVQVFREGPSQTVYYDGEPLEGVIGVITRQSGNHHKPIPPGLFMAAGPDIDKDAPIEEFPIASFTPTMLYGLGLPVAEDFDGSVTPELYSAAFRAAHPVETVPSYGARSATAVSTSAADDDMVDELRTLGYVE